jgi:hypothetical protein
MKTFLEWLNTVQQNPYNKHSFKDGPHQVLSFQYSPSIQIHSGVDASDRKYFEKLFGNGSPSSEEMASFIHSQPDSEIFNNILKGSKMVAYSDGKIVIGKAPYHAELVFDPDPGLPRMEGYFNHNSRTIKVTNAKDKSFFDIAVWKIIMKNLLDARLIDTSWQLVGCPPDCDGVANGMTVKQLLDQKGKVASYDGPTPKEKEAEFLAQNFLTKQAIQNRGSDLTSYLYRHGA